MALDPNTEEHVARAILLSDGRNAIAGEGHWPTAVAHYREMCAQFPDYADSHGVIPDAFRSARAAILAYLQHAGEAEPVGARNVRAAAGLIDKAAREIELLGPKAEAAAVNNIGYYLECASKALAAPHPHQAPEGWVPVPAEPTPEMLKAGMDDLGWWVEPYEAPRESGVPIECDISAEDAASINSMQVETVASAYRAMIAASPSKQATASADQGGE